ncbi:MAG: Zn-dependent protease with chaperone function [Colwellia sp.]|jgi:Zn-dependent protease with chaperone function|uniref:M56 family metallopeptidase n=1 Tax=Pseudoalteromonas sp. S201 TaxID=579519 RepID=UPI002017FCEF|nr:M56 family metallopeptidase [Pseudoalteromonas sp. S201]
MTEVAMAITLNTLAIVIVAFLISNIVLSIASSLLAQKFLSLQVASRKILLWFIVLLPWIAAFSIGLYFLNSYLSSSTFEYAHWHHMAIFEWYSWHGTSLIVAATYTVYVLLKKALQLLSHRQEISALTELSLDLGNGVYEIELPEGSAFTTGFFNKKCFVTSGLISETTEEELAVVIAHEKAHAANNDPFKKWMFSLFSSFFIASVAARLNLHLTLAMEQDADNAVIDANKTSTFIAGTLVKIARLNASGLPVSDNELVVNFGADVLEQRVYFLLGHLKLKPLNKVAAMFSVSLILLACFSSIDGIHHLIEKIFSH